MPGLRGGGPEGDEQVGLAGAGVADQAEWLPGLDPGAGGELMDDGGGDGGVGGEVELVDAFVAGEPGVRAIRRAARRVSRSSHSAITSSARNPR